MSKTTDMANKNADEVGLAPWAQEGPPIPAGTPSSRWTGHKGIGLAGGHRPTVACRPSSPYERVFLWEQDSNVYWRKRRSNGSWSSNPARLATGCQPAVAARNTDRLVGVFANEFSNVWNIYRVHYDKNGWGLPRNISHTSGSSSYPHIAGDGTNLFAVWEDTTPGYSIIYAGLPANQADPEGYWVCGPIPSAHGRKPRVAYVNGVAHVVWEDTDEGQVMYSHYGGSTWSLPAVIPWSNQHQQLQPRIAVNPATDDVHIVWRETRTGGYSYILYTVGQGYLFTYPRQVSWGSHGMRDPAMAISGGWLLVTWANAAGAGANPDRVLARKKPLTTPHWNWYATEIVSDAGAAYRIPELAVDANGIVAGVWERDGYIEVAERGSTYP